MKVVVMLLKIVLILLNQINMFLGGFSPVILGWNITYMCS